MISLKVIHRASAAKASHYYADQKDDYYSKDGTATQWQGKAASALGLMGSVDPQDLLRALRGDFGPEVVLSRSVRKDAKARAALDITFSPPKSISIQALIGRDGSVINVHDLAVTRALEFLERELVRARQRENGVTTTEKTGNAVIAKFRHETARPTKGAYSDPQLHTHALLMNVTQRADGTWSAMANDEIYRLKPLLEAIYLAELANGLERKSYGLRYENKTFELANISREQIAAFSKRSQDIADELAGRGKTRQTASHALKQAIAIKTRLGKAPEIDRAALQADWAYQATSLDVDFDRHLPAPQLDLGTATGNNARIADECLRWAIKHHTERECVMEGQEMLRTALRRSHGTDVTIKDLKLAVKRALSRGHLILGLPRYRRASDRDGEALLRSAWVAAAMANGKSKKHCDEGVRLSIARGELIPVGAQYTTQIAREREKRILQIEREGRDTLSPILQAEVACESLANCGLTPGQSAAAGLILTTKDRFVGVQGLAGTGKSHMLAQVISAAEAAGYTVRAVASYAKQIQALREHGVEARTLASVMAARQKDRFRLDAKTVLVVDEAGVVPVRVMEWIMKTAEADGARVVMLGDTGQTKAIEAGKPFHQLQDAGMATALMSNIIRQKDPVLRQSVELAAHGHASASLRLLSDKLGSVQTIDDNHDRYRSIAHTYAALSPDERAKTLIITGTNSSRNALNQATHDALGLSGRGFEFTLLTRRDTTQAERRVAKYFVAGDIIQPERDYRAGNLFRGEMYRVIGTITDKPNELEVEHVATKLRRAFNPARTTKISVYEPVRAELSAGDWIRVTRNNAEFDLVNGGRFEVIAVTPTTVRISDGEQHLTLDASTAPLHLDRGYASTSHSAQGLTCARVLYNAESFTRTTQSDAYYVGVSRARCQVDIFSDNADRLANVVDRSAEKSVALRIHDRSAISESQIFASQTDTTLVHGLFGRRFFEKT